MEMVQRLPGQWWSYLFSSYFLIHLLKSPQIYFIFVYGRARFNLGLSHSFSVIKFIRLLSFESNHFLSEFFVFLFSFRPSSSFSSCSFSFFCLLLTVLVSSLNVRGFCNIVFGSYAYLGHMKVLKRI